VAHLQDFALPAEAGQALSFGLSKGFLGGAFEELDERCLANIPGAMGRIDKVIT
jgi:hypothetical protein